METHTTKGCDEIWRRGDDDGDRVRRATAVLIAAGIIRMGPRARYTGNKDSRHESSGPSAFVRGEGAETGKYDATDGDDRDAGSRCGMEKGNRERDTAGQRKNDRGAEDVSQVMLYERKRNTAPRDVR